MADAVHDVQQDFWRPPPVLEPTVEAPLSIAAGEMAAACAHCGTEFMIGAQFCHSCGRRRPLANTAARTSPERCPRDASGVASHWTRSVATVRGLWARFRGGWLAASSIRAASIGARSVAASWGRISFPAWVQYLHFHEIKRWIGLPTAALVAFITGLGCVAGAVGVSLFYKASNLAEFQAIQMWRIEWLLAATASFVAGILLKRPSGS